MLKRDVRQILEKNAKIEIEKNGKMSMQTVWIQMRWQIEFIRRSNIIEFSCTIKTKGLVEEAKS